MVIASDGVWGPVSDGEARMVSMLVYNLQGVYFSRFLKYVMFTTVRIRRGKPISGATHHIACVPGREDRGRGIARRWRGRREPQTAGTMYVTQFVFLLHTVIIMFCPRSMVHNLLQLCLDRTCGWDSD